MRITTVFTLVAGSVLAGSPVPGAAQPAEETVTFNENVAPIFHESCTTCRRPGQVAPMSLLTYEDARPWARAIRQKVLEREMPPWGADPAVGTWANDRSLSEEALATIVAWVDGEAPRHRRPDAPTIRASVSTTRSCRTRRSTGIRGSRSSREGRRVIPSGAPLWGTTFHPGTAPEYDFNWQIDYIFDEPLALPAGSRIHASAWYDNSAANRSNPDPTAEVRWGEQTDEEMMFTALSFLVDDDAPPSAGQR